MILQDGNILASYSDNVNVHPDTIALFQLATGSSGWTLLGCYTDSISARTLSQRVITISVTAMTIEACQAACYALAYSLAGVEFSQECCKYLATLIQLLAIPPKTRINI